MGEVNTNISAGVERSKSGGEDILVESYMSKLGNKIEEFTLTMSVDTEALSDEPEGGKSWDEVEHYLKCIKILEEQPKNILLPYWGSVELPSPEELANPNTNEYTPKDVLGRLFVVSAALDVQFDYYNPETSEEESMSLGQLIADVYPGLEGGMKDIRKELELAFRNPEEFKKKFSKKENSSLGGLTRRAFIRKGMGVTAASLFILTSMTLASYSSKEAQADPNHIMNIVTEKEAISEEMEDSIDCEAVEIEAVLNEEVREILSLTTNLEFDNEGNLFFEDSTGELKPVSIFETERHLTYPYTPVEEVKFFVIHYDGGPLKLASGSYRTVFNTLNGLNREGKPSVQFCVDPYPITDDISQDGGLGIILSQEPNDIPYKGKHVQIGMNLETGTEDVNRVKTARLYEEIGVGSNFTDFVNSGKKDFNSYSLGVEQVGTNYSINFPEQFPPKQQIANMVALSKAVVDRYNLNIWDIVGHGDIQEKSDPGDEYMLTLKYLLGITYVKGTGEFPEDFLDGESFYDFLINLKKYGISKMGEDRYMQWNEVYGMEEVLRIFEEEMGQTENVDTKYKEASNKEVAYEAILAATREFAGEPYSWDRENHHCSGYVAQYFKYLGFSIDLVTDPVSTYTPNRGDPMPNATTVKQVKYLQMISENYGADLTSEITLKEMLSNRDIWEGIPAGTVLYLPERIGHHGYDTFTHTAIFMGLDDNNEPMFSEFSSYMKEGPEYGHGFEQFARMYRGENIEPYNPRNGELKVFMFDAVEASKRIKLNRESIRRDFSHKTLGQSGRFIR